MKKLRLSNIPNKLGFKITNAYEEFKHLKKDAFNEGINMLSDFKGDMIEIKNFIINRNKVNISLNETSDCSSFSAASSNCIELTISGQLSTNLNDSSLKSVDIFYHNNTSKSNPSD